VPRALRRDSRKILKDRMPLRMNGSAVSSFLEPTCPPLDCP
jgi:hypothetical protein